MFNRRDRFAHGECEHSSTVKVQNSGLERTVCASCGHVSFRGLEGLSGKASRGQFERGVERSASIVG
jgi:hypothetical protein